MSVCVCECASKMMVPSHKQQNFTQINPINSNSKRISTADQNNVKFFAFLWQLVKMHDVFDYDSKVCTQFKRIQNSFVSHSNQWWALNIPSSNSKWIKLFDCRCHCQSDVNGIETKRLTLLWMDDSNGVHKRTYKSIGCYVNVLWLSG